jgi:acyl-CoA dehydrogenase
MAIDFSFPPEIDEVRVKVRDFLDQVVRPVEKKADAEGWERDDWVKAIIEMRQAAKEWGLWLPHMPEAWGGMGLGHVAMASVSAEAGKTRMGPSCTGPPTDRKRTTSAHSVTGGHGRASP